MSIPLVAITADMNKPKCCLNGEKWPSPIFENCAETPEGAG